MLSSQLVTSYFILSVCWFQVCIGYHLGNAKSLFLLFSEHSPWLVHTEWTLWGHGGWVGRVGPFPMIKVVTAFQCPNSSLECKCPLKLEHCNCFPWRIVWHFYHSPQLPSWLLMSFSPKNTPLQSWSLMMLRSSASQCMIINRRTLNVWPIPASILQYLPHLESI